jgi:hypothetical protein
VQRASRKVGRGGGKSHMHHYYMFKKTTHLACLGANELS